MKTSATIADELSRKYVGPLVRGLDVLAEFNGGRGTEHMAASAALDMFIEHLRKMREGHK